MRFTITQNKRLTTAHSLSPFLCFSVRSTVCPVANTNPPHKFPLESDSKSFVFVLLLIFLLFSPVSLLVWSLQWRMGRLLFINACSDSNKMQTLIRFVIPSIDMMCKEPIWITYTHRNTTTYISFMITLNSSWTCEFIKHCACIHTTTKTEHTSQMKIIWKIGSLNR